MKKWKYLLLIPVLFFVIHVSVTIVYGLNDRIAKSDLAVVFGNTVSPDGVPSDRLQARLDRSKELFDQSLVEKILVSGGTGAEGFNEAVAMKNYLVAKGIPDNKIVLDTEGNNTRLTAQNAFKIANQENLKSVILVSQYFHLLRAHLLFQKAGFETVGTSYARYFEWRDVYSLIREFFAYYYSILRNA